MLAPKATHRLAIDTFFSEADKYNYVERKRDSRDIQNYRHSLKRIERNNCPVIHERDFYIKYNTDFPH